MRKNKIKTIVMIVMMIICFTITAFGKEKHDNEVSSNGRYNMLWCTEAVWSFFGIYLDGAAFTYDESSTHESKTYIAYFLYDDGSVSKANSRVTSDLKTIITFEGKWIDKVKTIHRLTDNNEISRVTKTIDIKK